MSFLGVFLTIIGLLIIVYGIIMYNGLISIKHNVAKAWSNIDVLLKQRHEELPNLVEVCKGYIKHERDTLESLMDIRTKAFSAKQSQDISSVGQCETEIRQQLGKLFATVENYPDLKADKHYIRLQERITALENQIADRRELYNENVTINNMRIQVIPDTFVAKLCGFGPMQLLEFDENSLKPPQWEKF